MLSLINKVLGMFNAVPFNIMPSWANLFFIRPIVDENSPKIVRFLVKEDGLVNTPFGNLKVKKDKHYVLSDGKDKWPVRKDIFEKTYQEVELGYFKKIPNLIFMAYETLEEHRIYTLEGDVVAKVGDYVISGSIGEQWVVTPEQFDKKYKRYYF